MVHRTLDEYRDSALGGMSQKQLATVDLIGASRKKDRRSAGHELMHKRRMSKSAYGNRLPENEVGGEEAVPHVAVRSSVQRNDTLN